MCRWQRGELPRSTKVCERAWPQKRQAGGGGGGGRGGGGAPGGGAGAVVAGVWVAVFAPCEVRGLSSVVVIARLSQTAAISLAAAVAAALARPVRRRRIN